MDENGMELMLLSLNAPAVQALPDPARAAAIARRANDFLAEEVRKRPRRFQGLAALAMQDPDGATRELVRCVKELGFSGALVNGFSQVDEKESMVYLDDARYRGFWAQCEKLDVPFYLHPRNPLPSASQIYEGHPWLLGPTWAFGQETAVHALRLMASGLFDAHPRLKIVLGHLGEGLALQHLARRPSQRLDEAAAALPGEEEARRVFPGKLLSHHVGQLPHQSLIGAMLEIGADRILFSTDWPFENIDHAAKWFDAAPISEDDRRKIGRDNAVRLFPVESGIGVYPASCAHCSRA
jgi:2,3-dihydroxybenzoate decarboxylase